MANKTGTAGNDTLTGTTSADQLFGLAGNDSLLGLGGNDRLEGGGGNDTLNGGIGIDTLIGGGGNDSYIVDNTGDTVTEAANLGRDTVQSSVSYTLGDNLDNLTLTGTGAINGIGNSLNNTITGNAGNNTLFGRAGEDTLYGGDGNDTLFGGNNDVEASSSIDILDGGNGNDNLNGEDGDDILIGGDGNDTLDAGYDGFFYGLFNDILFGGDGNDILFSSNGSSSLKAPDYTGSEDTLRGGNGNDTLYGGPANNTLEGGSGNDTYITFFGSDTISEAMGGGIDTIQTGVNYVLGDNLENLTLTGTSSINGTGNTLNNKIIGNAANNSIQAGSFGVVGERDTLTGGAGRDAFLLGNATQVFYDDRNKATAGTADYALITDFNTAQDAIKLNGNRNNYRLAASPAGLPGGTAIYRNKPGTEPDELIALVQGSSGLNLNGNFFRFTAEEINLSTLNGRNGFTINGIDAFDRSGFSVSDAGDVNGDGFDDLIIGALGGDPNDQEQAGESYVVFGKATGFSPNLNLSTLNGTNGFVVNGIDAGDGLGISVSRAGDVNADGFSDLVIGTGSGKSYVVFGKATGFSPSLNLSALDGTNGFKINSAGYDFAGNPVSGAGDVNGDGFDDLILGSPSDDGSYVVFGKATGFSPNLNLSTLDGTNGFQINSDYDLGFSVSDAGDINGDGFDDLVIGNPRSSYSDFTQTYVVFGKATGFNASLNVSDLNGSNGFEIKGSSEEFIRIGTSVSDAGDINGDGFDDLVIGGASQFSYNYGGGEALGSNRGYVVFGKATGFDASIDLSTLNGSNGFVINDIDAIGNRSGFKVSSAGDVNSDGFDDIIVGVSSNDLNNQNNAGISYVVFGKATGFDASLNLFDINGRNGFVINGIDAFDSSGSSVSSAGDVNGDGFDDLTVGAPDAYSNYQNGAGESYVIFGRDFTGSVTNAGTAGNDTLTGTAGSDVLIGGLGNDSLIGGAGIDVLIGGAGNDIISFGAIDRRSNGGSGVDTLRIDGSDSIDLTTIANNKFTSFELIDITGTGNNSLAFTRLDVLDLSDTTNRLIVNGNAGDKVTSTGQGWTSGSGTTVDSVLYRQYTAGAATLLVDADITQTIS